MLNFAELQSSYCQFQIQSLSYCRFMIPEPPLHKQQDYILTFHADKQDLLKIVDSIKLTNPQKFKYSFGFSSPYTMQYFINVLNRQSLEEQTAQGFKLAYYDTQKGRFSRLKFIRDQSFTEVVRLKFYSTLRLIVFMKIYAQRIKKMESEYQYQLIPGKDGNLLIYMKQKNISNMFRNQVSEMKRQLQCLQIRNQTYCQKVIYSKRFDTIFQKDQIKAELWYKQNVPCLVFYTFNMKQAKLRSIILQRLKYHMTILKFIDQRSNYQTNCILFRLMQGKIHQSIQEIKTQFNMEIQFNQDKCAIIIHDIDIVFQRQVKQCVLNTFSSLIFISVKDKRIRNLSNFLRRNPQQFSQISTCYYKETLYLCFNKDTLDKPTLKKLFYKVSEHLCLQSVIVFSWFHLTQIQHKLFRQQIVQNISNSVQNSSFIVQNFKYFANDTDRRAVLKLKQFDISDKSSQYGEIVEVLLDSIYKNQKNPIKVIQSSSQYDSIYQIGQTSIQSQSLRAQKNQNYHCSSQKSQNSTNLQPFQHVQPETVQMQQDDIWKSTKRDRQMQDKFYQFYSRTAKIWKLQLNSRYYKKDQTNSKIGYCPSSSLNSSMRIKSQELLDIKNCKVEQIVVGIYYIQQGSFAPTYLIRMIDQQISLF